MKTFLFMLSVFALLLPLRAEEFLLNGDFSDGTKHWTSDSKSPTTDPSEGIPPDLSAKPVSTKGLIIALKSRDWTHVSQTFSTKGINLYLTVVYAFSLDASFSQHDTDYEQAVLSPGGNPFNVKPGLWFIVDEDVNDSGHSYCPIHAQFGSTDPITFHKPCLNTSPNASRTLTLAFPPGHGTVTILSVSMKGAGTSPSSNPQ